MAARRCSTDNIHFPTGPAFQTCPVCHQPTDYFGNQAPDDDWANRVATLQEHHAQATEEPPEIPEVVGRVVVREDNFFIHAWDVYHSGLRYALTEGTLVRVGQQTFEVIGRIDREYVVRPFSTTLSDDDLARLAGGG